MKMTMSVGTIVQTTSAMLLPWVCAGSVVVARLAPIADDRPDDQPLDDEEDRRPRSGTRSCTGRGSWRPARSPRSAGRGSLTDRPGGSTAVEPEDDSDADDDQERAPIPMAKIAVCEGRDLGELDIKVLGGWRRAPGRHGDRCGQQACVDRRGPNRRHSTRSDDRRASRPARRHARPRLRGDDAVDGSSDARVPVRSPPRSARPCVAAGAGAVVAGAGRGPRPGPGRPADRRVAAPRLDVRAAADARDRSSRSAGGCGRSAGWTRAHPDQPGPAPPDGGVPRRHARARRSRCCRASSRYDTTLFSVHMVQHVLLMLVAAPLHRPGRADHAAAARSLAPATPAALDPAGPPFAGDAGPGLPGRRLADLRRGDVGDPLLAAVQRRARGPAGPRPRARACSSVGALLFWWPAVALDPAPWRMTHPVAIVLRVPADDPEHVPRGRDPERDDRALSALRDARPAVGHRRRSTTSGWPPGSCGSPAT